MNKETTKKKVTRIIAHLPDGKYRTLDYPAQREMPDLSQSRELGRTVWRMTQAGARLEIAVVEVDA